MRDIKFRAYSPKHDSLSPPGTMIEILEMAHEEYGDGSFIKQLVWQEYTGLKDSEGHEIYEGDILVVKDNGFNTIHEVRYFGHKDYPAFDLHPSIDTDENGLSWAMATCTIKILGNVHENPGLLEVN